MNLTEGHAQDNNLPKEDRKHPIIQAKQDSQITPVKGVKNMWQPWNMEVETEEVEVETTKQEQQPATLVRDDAMPHHAMASPAANATTAQYCVNLKAGSDSMTWSVPMSGALKAGGWSPPRTTTTQHGVTWSSGGSIMHHCKVDSLPKVVDSKSLAPFQPLANQEGMVNYAQVPSYLVPLVTTAWSYNYNVPKVHHGIAIAPPNSLQPKIVEVTSLAPIPETEPQDVEATGETVRPKKRPAEDELDEAQAQTHKMMRGESVEQRNLA